MIHSHLKDVFSQRRKTMLMKCLLAKQTPLLLALFILAQLIFSPAVLAQNTTDTLRAAIKDLQMKYGDRYLGAEAFLDRLNQKQNQSGNNFAQLQQEALRAHPLISNTPLLFIERPQYAKDHNSNN
jgi:hypothetical protein